MDNKGKILIVDDETNICLTLSKILTLKGYAVSVLGNGLHAVELVQKEDFDFVLMDVKMPIMNGVETFKHIKQLKPDTYIVLMSAFSPDHAVKDLLKAGNTDCFMQKPLDIDGLLNLIKFVVKE